MPQSHRVVPAAYGPRQQQQAQHKHMREPSPAMLLDAMRRKARRIR